MSPSHTEVEDRLTRSYRAFVADVPDRPLVPWSTFAMTSNTPNRHWRRIIGTAASIVLIALATILWASPSAGARYHGAEGLNSRSPGITELQRAHPCMCASSA
jgi:hypothetical protein